MSRELLERALDALDQIWDYGLENFPQDTHETLMDDIKSFLSTPEPKPIAYWDTQNGTLIQAVPLSSERTCFKVPLVPLYLSPRDEKESGKKTQYVQADTADKLFKALIAIGAGIGDPKEVAIQALENYMEEK